MKILKIRQMKNMHIHIALFVLLITFVVGCKKSTTEGILATYQTGILENNAMLKINNAAIFRSNPNFKIKINDTIVTHPFTARTPYPGGGYNTGGNSLGTYLSVPSGNVKVSLMIPYMAGGTAQDTLKWKTDSISLFSTTLQLTNGKYYTLHITDTVKDNLKHVLLEENDVTPIDTLPYYRFVNLMPNVPSLDLYFGPTKVASNVAYLTSSAEFTVDINQASQAWTIREAGDTSTVASTAIATYTSSGTITKGRKYTAFAMGYQGLSGTTEPRRPFISFFLTK